MARSFRHLWKDRQREGHDDGTHLPTRGASHYRRPAFAGPRAVSEDRVLAHGRLSADGENTLLKVSPPGLWVGHTGSEERTDDWPRGILPFSGHEGITPSGARRHYLGLLAVDARPEWSGDSCSETGGRWSVEVGGHLSRPRGVKRRSDQEMRSVS